MDSTSKKMNGALGLIVVARGNEHVLPDGDGSVRVGNGCVVGLDVDGCGGGIQIDRNGVAIEFSRETQIAENLSGKRPQLHIAILETEDGPGGPGHSERMLRLYGLTNDKGAIGKRKLRHRLKPRLGGSIRENHQWRKKDANKQNAETLRIVLDHTKPIAPCCWDDGTQCPSQPCLHEKDDGQIKGLPTGESAAP